MQGLIHAAGPIATMVICLLIMVEEAGVPLPMFPGDLLLITAGVMIATGQISPWVFIPLALASALTGAMIGHAWTRRVGQGGLMRLAERLRVRRHVDAAAVRLRRSGATGVVIGRLVVPGARVYTTLVAGAVGMPRRTFFRGLVVSSTLWVFLFTGLGMLIGYPAVAYLHQMEGLVLMLLAQAAPVVAAAIGLRYVRAPRWDSTRGPTPVRTLLAAAVDLTLAAVVGVAVWSITDMPATWASPAVCVALFATTLSLRLASRATLGERLAQVSYRDVLIEAHAGAAALLGRLVRRAISDA